jgi:hypothetical protein
MDERARELEAFIHARAGSLLRFAYLLTGDHALAEDLLQNSLISPRGFSGRAGRPTNAGLHWGGAPLVSSLPPRSPPLPSWGRWASTRLTQDQPTAVCRPRQLPLRPRSPRLHQEIPSSTRKLPVGPPINVVPRAEKRGTAVVVVTADHVVTLPADTIMAYDFISSAEGLLVATHAYGFTGGGPDPDQALYLIRPDGSLTRLHKGPSTVWRLTRPAGTTRSPRSVFPKGVPSRSPPGPCHLWSALGAGK